MATFREIDERLLALVNEDGEILDVEAFQQLQMERETKDENMALWALDLKDEQEAIKQEIQRLQGRLKSAATKEQSLREYLQAVLGGQKLKTARVSVGYRTTQAVEITDEDGLRQWAMTDPKGENVLRYREPEISKTAIREMIEAGGEVPGARIATRQSTTIR